MPTALAAVLGRTVFRATHHNHLLHACIAAAGQGATAVVNGDEIAGAAALEADNDENADPTALLSVQSQGKVTNAMCNMPVAAPAYNWRMFLYQCPGQFSAMST